MSFTGDKDSDNFMTNEEEWNRIKEFIPNDKKIWAPFYGDGKQKQYFSNMGFDIIHEDRDFFQYTPDFDIIIDNPPFSNLRKILEKIKELENPFMLLMPSSKINAIWFLKMFKEHLQIIIPINKLHFTNLNEDKKFNFNWGVYVYCYKMNLEKDLIFI
tara:strand:- start:1057 stop:1530 length:474 start_codon:yes stop_codon:yes gene_type:complete